MAVNVIINGQDSTAQNNFYGTVGTAAVQVLATSVLSIPSQSTPSPGQLRQFLQIHNPSTGTVLAYTTDGTTPVINGTGITLYPGSTSTYDTRVPPGPITLIASSSSTPYTIMSM